MKDDPLQQSDYAQQVHDQLSKHTLWLNADNFEEMIQASYEGYQQQHPSSPNATHVYPKDAWRMMCAAALAVVEWRMGGRVRP